MDKMYRLFKINILDDCKNTGIFRLKFLTPKNIIEYILKTTRENKTDIWASPLLTITSPLYK